MEILGPVRHNSTDWPGSLENPILCKSARDGPPAVAVQLLAIDLVVLCGGDLPFTVALQPGIGPDLALFGVGMGFVFPDRVLTAVNDGHVLARRRRKKCTLASSSAQP